MRQQPDQLYLRRGVEGLELPRPVQRQHADARLRVRRCAGGDHVERVDVPAEVVVVGRRRVIGIGDGVLAAQHPQLRIGQGEARPRIMAMPVLLIAGQRRGIDLAALDPADRGAAPRMDRQHRRAAGAQRLPQQLGQAGQRLGLQRGIIEGAEPRLAVRWRKGAMRHSFR